LFDTVACATYRRLDASIGASERHDFAVRVGTVRHTRRSVHRIPPHVRNVRNAPLRDGTVQISELICPRRQAKFLKFRNRPERELGRHPRRP
jgi:hypothetical protein